MDYLNILFCNLTLAIQQKRQFCIVRNSNLIREILVQLINLGYIFSFTLLDSFHIQIFLKYTHLGHCALRTIKRVSRPGARVYVSYRHLQQMSRLVNVNNIYQNTIISTSMGIKTHSTAIRNRQGGELLFLIN